MARHAQHACVGITVHDAGRAAGADHGCNVSPLQLLCKALVMHTLLFSAWRPASQACTDACQRFTQGTRQMRIRLLVLYAADKQSCMCMLHDFMMKHDILCVLNADFSLTIMPYSASLLQS